MALNNLVGTYFEGGSKSVLPKTLITFDELDEMIKSDKMKQRFEIIQNFKNAGDKDSALQMKLNSPYVCMLGTFQRRENAGLQDGTFNWLIAWDIDGKMNEGIDLKKVRERIEKTPSTVYCCMSTSGTGLRGYSLLNKGAFRFERDTFQPKMKDVIVPYLERIWECKLDPAMSRLSQPWFLTYDPSPYHNWEASPVVDVDYTYMSVESIESSFIDEGNKVFGSLTPYLNRISTIENEKHNFYLRIGTLIGGLFTGGLLDKHLTEEKIIDELKKAVLSNRHIDNYETAKRTIIDSFLYGKRSPITKDSFKINKTGSGIMDLLEQRLIDKNYDTKRHPFVLIGNDYWKENYEDVVDGFGNKRKIKKLYPFKRQTIIDLYGAEMIKRIPALDEFCNEPDYFNYQPIIKNRYNIANPLIHEIKQGEFKTITHLIKHIFGDQWKFGMAYLQLLLLKPKQKLPVLCLVSRENETGKTTFINFLDVLFYGNNAIISTADFELDFNRHYISKNIICIDESELDGRENTSKIKQIATQEYAVVNEKFVAANRIEFHGKLIILSNNEEGFLQINDEDLRYWIVKPPVVRTFDPEYEDKLEKEIPAFLYFLKNTPLIYGKKKSRLWFDVSELNNEVIEHVREYNKSAVYHNLIRFFEKYFLQHPDATECRTTPSTLWDIDQYIKMHYSLKAIAKSLRDEFYCERPERKVERFKDDISGVEEVGAPYIIKKKCIKKYN